MSPEMTDEDWQRIDAEMAEDERRSESIQALMKAQIAKTEIPMHNVGVSLYSPDNTTIGCIVYLTSEKQVRDIGRKSDKMFLEEQPSLTPLGAEYEAICIDICKDAIRSLGYNPDRHDYQVHWMSYQYIQEKYNGDYELFKMMN